MSVDLYFTTDSSFFFFLVFRQLLFALAGRNSAKTGHLLAINVAPHSDCKWNGTGFVCSSDSKPQKMLSWKCYLVGRP